MLGKIFISYRRGDDPGSAGRLSDALKEAFGADQLFIDVDNIEPGLDFIQVIQERIAQSEILLAVIGKHWIDARETDGSRRLDNPSDPVRVEIESAIEQNKRVIPVLIGDTKMPALEDLPESLRPLSRRNGVQIRHERFSDDAAHLTAALKRSLRVSGADGPEAAAAETQSRTLGLYTDNSSSDIAGRTTDVARLPSTRLFHKSRAVFTITGLAAVAFVTIAAAFYFSTDAGSAGRTDSQPSSAVNPSQPHWCLDSNLKPDELRVCGNQRLWTLDNLLGDLYGGALAISTVDKRSALVEEQRAWLRDTRGSCRQDENCLSTVYQERISYFTKLKNH